MSKKTTNTTARTEVREAKTLTPAAKALFGSKPKQVTAPVKKIAIPNVTHVRESKAQDALVFSGGKPRIELARWPIPGAAEGDLNSEFFVEEAVAHVAATATLTPKQALAFCRTLHVPASGNVVPASYKAKYGKAQNCGDAMASVLTDAVTREVKTTTPGGKQKLVARVDLEALARVAKANGIEGRLAKWAGLNSGMQRMNLGNVLRGMLKRGEAVTVGKRTWPARKVAKAAKAA